MRHPNFVTKEANHVFYFAESHVELFNYWFEGRCVCMADQGRKETDVT